MYNDFQKYIEKYYLLIPSQKIYGPKNYLRITAKQAKAILFVLLFPLFFLH
jgi:hypothetical protein